MNTFEIDVSRALGYLRETALGEVADRYAASLAERRLAATTTAKYLRAAVHFGRWLHTDPVRTVPSVRREDVHAFVSTHLRRCKCPPRAPRTVADSRAALHLLARVLRERGWYEEPPRRAATAVEEEIDRFDGHLREVCGAALQTRLHRTRHVREFLRFLFADGPVRHERIDPDSFGRFLAARRRRCRPGTAGVITDGLRSYVHFLELHGHARQGLREAVPQVARWRLATLPAHLTAEELERFLRSFDPHSKRGRRDEAMALCLAVLGLRASEVADLRLASIDWRAGTLTVAPVKTGRGRVLPLPPRVGRAIVAYLRVRPRSTSDRLFVRVGALEGDPIAPSVVRSAVRLGYRRAGLSARCTGTHILRHTAATRLVTAGVPVKAVADVLGHASLDSVAVYAKVDLPRLRAVALPWVEVSR